MIALHQHGTDRSRALGAVAGEERGGAGNRTGNDRDGKQYLRPDDLLGRRTLLREQHEPDHAGPRHLHVSDVVAVDFRRAERVDELGHRRTSDTTSPPQYSLTLADCVSSRDVLAQLDSGEDPTSPGWHRQKVATIFRAAVDRATRGAA